MIPRDVQDGNVSRHEYNIVRSSMYCKKKPSTLDEQFGMTQKRKYDQILQHYSNGFDTSRPTAIYQPLKGRPYTLSIALPGSIIANAKSHESKTTLAGQIGRALAVFCVDEVVIFNDGHAQQHHQKDKWRQHKKGHHNLSKDEEPTHEPYTGDTDPDHFLMYLLSYLETPPYLRKTLFSFHPNLKYQGTLPSLALPHHLAADERCQYREGVTIQDSLSTSRYNFSSTKDNDKKKKRQKSDSESERPSDPATFLDAGLSTSVVVQASIPPNTRVTLKFPKETSGETAKEYIIAEAVSPETPREEAGYYWGYSIRRAPSLSTVFTECTYDGGYDVTFGTSERGTPLNEILSITHEDEDTQVPRFKHMLVAFGGVAGLEAAVKADEELRQLNVQAPEALFDYWVNVCEGQGSRTIRTEEALWIGLAGLRNVVLKNESNLKDTVISNATD